MARDIEEAKTVIQLNRGALKRVLKVFDLFAIGYGDLGSSIYYALGITALYALGATPIALGLAGLVFVCTALTYAEMTSSFHESGGSASFARHAFNDLVSFIAGWGLLLDYIVTIAISAFAVAPYLAVFVPELKLAGVQIGLTIGIVVILFLINFFGIKESTRMSFVLVAFTLLTQLLIILIGIGWFFEPKEILTNMQIGQAGLANSPTWPEFWKGTAMAMVAYTGIESIAQLGAEAKRPARNVPRAIVITMVVLIVSYLGISLVALSVVSPQALSQEYLQDPIAGIISGFPSFFRTYLAPWVGLLAASLLFVAANAGLIGASRLAFNMGEYYQLPRFFYKIHPKFRTPYPSLLFFTIVASLIVIASRGKLDFLADLYNFGAMIAFFFAHASLIMMRIKKPDLKRPFRIALNIPIGRYRIPLTAVVGVLATFGVWVLVVITKPEGRYMGIAWMCFGIFMYFYYRKKQRISPTGHLAVEHIKIPDFSPLKMKHLLVPIRGGVETETMQMACELAKLHGANITALHVIEVPPSLPLDDVLLARLSTAELILKRAEAIAREEHVSVELKTVFSRSIASAILEVLKGNHFDHLVLGTTKKSHRGRLKGLGPVTERLVREANCRVWICCSDKKKESG